MVERSLCMREVKGSMPFSSSFVPFCQLRPEYMAPGRETQRFQMAKSAYVFAASAASAAKCFDTEGAWAPARLGLGPNLCVEAFCC